MAGDDVMEGLLVGQVRETTSRFYGKYRGVVTDVDDPEGRGRIKAKVDALNGSESDWALPVLPFAGQSHGLVLLLATGGGVWFEVEAGDTNRPLCTGGLGASEALATAGGTRYRQVAA